VIKVIFKKKDRWSEVGNFPAKGGGSLGSLKYQVFLARYYPTTLSQAFI